jgi:hypothetical protein
VRVVKSKGAVTRMLREREYIIILLMIAKGEMEIWEVLRGDGTLICHCGTERDAMELACMYPGRTYRRMLRIAPEIIDVCAIVEGGLPGNLGLPGRGPQVEGTQDNRLRGGEGLVVDV